MRIITDGKYYAVAKGKWIFTKVLSPLGYWFPAYCDYCEPGICWVDLQTAKDRLEKEQRPMEMWWDFKE